MHLILKENQTQTIIIERFKMYFFHERIILPLDLKSKITPPENSERKVKFKLNYPAIKLTLFLVIFLFN